MLWEPLKPLSNAPASEIAVCETCGTTLKALIKRNGIIFSHCIKCGREEKVA